jgi:hypothetical protein
MRYLTAILGVLAMLVTLSGPVAALSVRTPCSDASMVAMADDMAPCKPAAMTCADNCLAASNCQNQCGSWVPFARVEQDDFASPHFAALLHVAQNEQPTGTDSPVDGPPPRF